MYCEGVEGDIDEADRRCGVAIPHILLQSTSSVNFIRLVPCTARNTYSDWTQTPPLERCRSIQWRQSEIKPSVLHYFPVMLSLEHLARIHSFFPSGVQEHAFDVTDSIDSKM